MRRRGTVPALLLTLPTPVPKRAVCQVPNLVLDFCDETKKVKIRWDTNCRASLRRGHQQLRDRATTVLSRSGPSASWEKVCNFGGFQAANQQPGGRVPQRSTDPGGRGCFQNDSSAVLCMLLLRLPARGPVAVRLQRSVRLDLSASLPGGFLPATAHDKYTVQNTG